MARNLFSIEKAIRLFKENSDTEFVDFLFGSAAPGGDAGEQDDAPIGSIYLRQNGIASSIFQKVFDNNNAADWLSNPPISVGTFRPENVVVVTNEDVGVGARDLVLNPFTDDEGTTVIASEFAVGDFLIDDAAGAPQLLEVSVVAGDSITLILPVTAPALTAQDSFVVANYLPDSPNDQEIQALALFNGSIMVKLGDVNWDFATGINISSGYTPGSGDPSSSDTVETAIEKVDGNNDDQDTLLGTAQGDTNLGTFSGDSYADNQSVKSILQRSEILLEQLRGVEIAAITAITTVDEVLVDDVRSCKWLIETFEDAAPANVKSSEIYALHNGTAVADATSTDDTQYAKLKNGSNFNLDITIDINGTGASQTMRLRATSSSAGVTVTARRLEVRKSIL